ncbi:MULTISPECIES: CPBP family intramembrane glutamic endopeptidase [unclassified Devosia]|uniref:CPBP family intramembrane glutamic endopeptidase n=1 Tax=unclassified Devosia TaxID=196773 RepID=UPI00086B1AC0|nr:MULTISPECIES: CPBP family intramembrane glutamic endopeptidase [unclassified Devosia]MBN9360315.1 CPBP family intramembrane metalloprotease [Devosia sp.]ODS94295.1 MAG: CAAX protease [Devosia sp. SCN 66-27]OJX22337.1 MAG: CAAX protease family protein [Devosia sp. 66-14]
MSERTDLPFYDGRPVEISGRGWLLVLLAVALGFAALVALPLDGAPLNFVPPLLFVAIPLGALAMVAGRHWTAPFRRYGIKQFGQSLGFGVLTIVVSGVAGYLLSLLTPMAANPAVTSLEGVGPAELVLFLSRTFIQLIGEELTTVLPLLAVLWLCVRRFGLPKRAGLIIAVVVSTLWFAALHLPTYDWNVLQCLGIIGTARIVLTLSYLVTRNLWVSVGAHIINDWTLFLGAYAIGHAPVGA